jgi:CRP/FNR family transcriptional regulator, cyclic AMP receptor protein
VAARRSASWGPSDRAMHTSPVLGSLQHDELSELLVAGRPARLRRGAPLLRSTDDLAALVLQGTAVAAAIGSNGQPVVVDFLGPGALAGLPVVLGQPDAGLDVTALTPLDGLLFQGSALRDRIGRQPTLAVACLRAVNAELAVARRGLADDADTSTAERVVDRLVHLAETWGEEQDGTVELVIPLTQEMLASWARSSRESTAKALHDLRQQGLIRTGRRSLAILDLEGLEARSRGRGHRADERAIRDLLQSLVG